MTEDQLNHLSKCKKIIEEQDFTQDNMCLIFNYVISYVNNRFEPCYSCPDSLTRALEYIGYIK